MLIPKEAWRIRLRDDNPLLQLCCPACGVWGDMDGHEVAADGSVTPSVVCANDGKLKAVAITRDAIEVQHQGDRTEPCTFHEHIQLENWIGAGKP